MAATIRVLAPSDSVEDLTRLLHEAYRSLVGMGLNYTAADQDEETTLRRINRGECVVAELDGAIFGTVTW